jgi:hypothetical protein
MISGYIGLCRFQGFAKFGLFAFVFMTVGCTTTPETPLGEWAYDFSLNSFVDKRPYDDLRMMVDKPFRINDFMTGWQANIGRNIFASAPAKLDVTLHYYEASQNARSYALTMEMSLQGRDQYGRLLAATNGRCNAVMRRDVDTWATMWGDFWQQPADQRDASPLTLEKRDATMWQKVMNECVKQFATSFGNTLTGPPVR